MVLSSNAYIRKVAVFYFAYSLFKSFRVDAREHKRTVNIAVDIAEFVRKRIAFLGSITLYDVQ